MTNIYMATVPANYWLKFRHFIKYFEQTDVKKWVIAYEKGRTGYEHYQIRFRSCETLEEIRQKTIFRNGSVDRADNWCDYERKGGHYITSDDTTEILKVRYGTPYKHQKEVIKALQKQSERDVLVWCDPIGNGGKSWLCNYLYETGQGFYCPPTIDTVKGLIQFISNGYNGESVIILDIPRSWKWSNQMYVAIESIKDGLIYDTRYHSQTRNIRGVKILVLCNEMPKVGKLSADRWQFINWQGGVCTVTTTNATYTL